MNSTEHLLARVAACGYRVELVNGSPQLSATRAECVMPPRLLAALKAHRAAVIDHLTRNHSPAAQENCRVCGRDVSDPEDRERVANSPAFCDRGGAPGVTDGHGVYHEPQERCPFKPTRETTA